METDENDLEQRCRQVIDQLLGRYAWELLDREEFVRRTVIAAQQKPSADIAYLAFGVYNHALYNACSGDEGPIRWEQGYTELFKMLCDRARYRYPYVWEDAVQIALETTCSHFAKCLIPQAFFQFTWGYLQNAVRSLEPQRRRADQRVDLSLERELGDTSSSLLNSLPDPQANIEERILNEEQRVELRAILKTFVEEHPGANRQIQAVALKFLDGKDDATISRMLGIPVKRVYELRALGLKQLRGDPRCRDLLGDQID